MKNNKAVWWVISIIVLVVVGTGLYSHRKAQSSKRVKAEMLRIIDDMTLPSESRDYVRQLLEDAHDEAFNEVLILTKRHDRKFDEERYFEMAFDRVIARARAEGEEDLARTIEREREHFSLTVTER